MNALTRKLHIFLSACGGNWRNSIYVFSCEGHYLVALDRDAKPVVMDLNMFCRMIGEQIEPRECRVTMPDTCFRDLYAQYLLWEVSDPVSEPLAELSRRSG